MIKINHSNVKIFKIILNIIKNSVILLKIIDFTVIMLKEDILWGYGMVKKSIIVIMSIFFSLTLFPVNEVKAENSDQIKNQIENNQDKIDGLNNQKNKLNQEKKSNESELDKLQETIDEKNKELLSSQQNVSKYQKEIDALQADINSVQAELDSLEKDIKDKEQEIIKKEKDREEKEELLGKRLRSIYKTSYEEELIVMLLNSRSFGDFISKMSMVSRVIKTDKGMIEEVKKAKKEVEEGKASLEKKVSYLNTEKNQIALMQEDVKASQKSYIEEQNKINAQVSSLKTLELQKQGVINNIASKEQQLQGEIEDLNSYNKDLQNQLDQIFKDINNNNNNSNNGGQSNNSGSESFIRPSTGRVTSVYGARVNPVTGVNGFHTGIDLGAPMGAPIKASKSGKVVTASYISGYGNTVILDHGSGIQTLYAHSSSLAVSVGQTVSQGQVIAYVGSTGNSTGPHLHFEIRVNGQHQNPTNYLSF